MIVPLILALAAFCQIASASPIEDIESGITQFMFCMMEGRSNFGKDNPLGMPPGMPMMPIGSYSHRGGMLKDLTRRNEQAADKILAELQSISQKPESIPNHAKDNLNKLIERAQSLAQERENTPLPKIEPVEKIAVPEGPSVNLHKTLGALIVNDSQVTWNEARNKCLDEKAQLAIIDSVEKEAEIINKMKDLNMIRAWIGVHDLFGDKQWTTIKGDRLETLSYVHWGDNQPDNYNENERCVVLNQRGMNDLACDSDAGYICQTYE